MPFVSALGKCIVDQSQPPFVVKEIIGSYVVSEGVTTSTERCFDSKQNATANHDEISAICIN